MEVTWPQVEKISLMCASVTFLDSLLIMTRVNSGRAKVFDTSLSFLAAVLVVVVVVAVCADSDFPVEAGCEAFFAGRSEDMSSALGASVFVSSWVVEAAAAAAEAEDEDVFADAFEASAVVAAETVVSVAFETFLLDAGVASARDDACLVDSDFCGAGVIGDFVEEDGGLSVGRDGAGGRFGGLPRFDSGDCGFLLCRGGDLCVPEREDEPLLLLVPLLPLLLLLLLLLSEEDEGDEARDLFLPGVWRVDGLEEPRPRSDERTLFLSAAGTARGELFTPFFSISVHPTSGISRLLARSKR